MIVPVFYDCEATGPHGYPIEIGWAFFDDTAGALVSEGHLIRPPAEWDVEAIWDPEAEKIHRIPLAHLRTHGRPACQVAPRMNEALAGREVFSDASDDEDWARKLFDAAGLDPSFTIRRMNARLLIAETGAGRGLFSDAIESAEWEAAKFAPRTHRAEADARYLATVWAMVAKGWAPQP